MRVLPFISIAIAAAAFALPASAQNADAANKLLKDEGCTKCHAVDKTKKGPAFQKVAADLKGKADAEAKLTQFLSTGPKIKIDGSEEEHKVVKDKAALPNLVKWILAQ